VTGLTIVCG